MKINSINIQNIGGIKELNLTFKNGLNLICGPNGIGKTTILNCLAQSFTQNQINDLRRNVNYEYGTFSIEITNNSNVLRNESKISTYSPNESKLLFNQFSDFSKYLLIFKTHRDIAFNTITSINRDPSRNSQEASQSINLGLNAHEFKNWFINRYMWSAQPNGITDEQRHNLELAKKAFTMLDKNISFSKVNGDTFDILINTPNGEIYYEYLSSGYKSNLCLIFGIIKEIEFRFKEPNIKVDDFNGVLLIDELDLHLHPQWQAVIITTLKNILPKAQIIATTHSPSMIQVAEPNEIIPLGYDENNKVCIKTIPNAEYGYQGWSVEEILTDVMGLEVVRSEKYTNILKEFETALQTEDIPKAKEIIKKLNLILHPQNPLRKIIKLQYAAIGGEE